MILKKFLLLAVSGTAMLPAYSKGYISYDESFKSNGMDIRFSSNQCNAFLEKLYECKKHIYQNPANQANFKIAYCLDKFGLCCL